MTSLPHVVTPAGLRRVVIVAFAEAQLLDIAGPADVFATANELCPNPVFDIVVASSLGGLIATTSGIAIDTRPIRTVDVHGIDTALLAGGARGGVVEALQDRPLAQWMTAVAGSARRYGSVCSGAFALARWGLLDGRRATTHWSATHTLRRIHVGTSVEPSALYVQDGHVWTSGGVTAGIDMCLAMVEEDLGRGLAARVARQLILSMRRLGNQSQYSQVLDLQAGRYPELVGWIRAHLGESLGVERLAEFVGESPRSFRRHFEAETGETPAAFVETIRLQAAKEHLEAGASVKAAARAAGVSSGEHLARMFKRRFGMTPRQYQAVHSP